MNKKRRLLSLTLVLAMCLSFLAACGNNNNANTPSNSPSSSPSTSPSSSPSSTSAAPPLATIAEPPPPPEPEARFADHVEVIIHESVGVLNVHSMAGTGLFTNNSYMMYSDSLVYMELDGSISPMLANSWETDDYQTWIFHLRDDVYFHNGDKLTAEDIVYTCNLGKEAIGSTAFESWSWVDSARAIDEYTLELKLTTVYVDFLYIMATPMTFPLSKRALEEDPEKGYWISTGAFKVAEFSSNDYVMFERNDDYWGELPYTKTITFQYIPEPSSRTIMMENGTGDLARGIPMTDFPIFRDNPDYYFIEAYGNNPYTIQFNMDDPVCGDWNFRMAVASAIDRENLLALSGINGAPVSPTEGTSWGNATPYKNTNIPAIPYDLDKAREYLAASPYDGTPIEFSYQVSAGRFGEALQEQLAKIGLEIALNPMDPPSFVAYTSWNENRAQMLLFASMMNLNPSAGYKTNFYPGSNNNRMRYSNPELTEMIEKAPAIFDETERIEYFYRMQEIVANDVPCIPIYWLRSVAIAQKNVGGFTIGVSSMEDHRHLYITLDD